MEDNRFIDPPNGILSAWAVDGVELIDNIVEAGPGTRTAPGPLVALHTGARFHISGLRVQDASGETTAVVEVGPAVPAGNKGLMFKGIEVDSPEPIPVLQDRRD